MLTMDGQHQTNKTGPARETSLRTEPPCCPLYAPVWAFSGRGGIRIPLQAFCGLSGECERSPKSMGELWIRADCGDEIAGSKRVQVKGRVALKSPLARFTPPGKAVRGFRLPPGKSRF